MSARVLQSVGIDIGTTTTQLVFSELHLRNLAGMTQMPRYAITERQLLYKSPVAFTPLKNRHSIDATALKELITHWYAHAGKTFADIESGAVIITGESLKASNARTVIMDMVSGLGDFVVASAGPHLESVFSGKGAGAAARSLAQPGCHLNVDIGGGTTNYAVFERGKPTDTACLNVGGRLIETDSLGEVLYVSEPAQPIVQAVIGPRPLNKNDLPAVAGRMAEMICSTLQGKPDPLSLTLLQTPPLKKAYAFQSVSFSGGVGACCMDNQGNPFRFGDMGPLLAEALLERLAAISIRLEATEQPVRATVIGAGAWSLTLSGGTVWTPSGLLPLRNVPVALVPMDWSAPVSNLAQKIADAVARLDLDAAEDVIIAFPSGACVTYDTVQALAQSIHKFYEGYGKKQAILVSVEDDMGKALGLELRSMTQASIVVIDEVHLEDGDYLDMARPLYSGGVVPLTIKSLAFPAAK